MLYLFINSETDELTKFRRDFKRKDGEIYYEVGNMIDAQESGHHFKKDSNVANESLTY